MHASRLNLPASSSLAEQPAHQSIFIGTDGLPMMRLLDQPLCVRPITLHDTALLAELTAELGDPTFRADATAACVLAAAGARAAAHLVAVNLTVQEGDPRLVRARRTADSAADAAARALDFAR